MRRLGTEPTNALPVEGVDVIRFWPLGAVPLLTAEKSPQIRGRTCGLCAHETVVCKQHGQCQTTSSRSTLRPYGASGSFYETSDTRKRKRLWMPDR